MGQLAQSPTPSAVFSTEGYVGYRDLLPVTTNGVLVVPHSFPTSDEGAASLRSSGHVAAFSIVSHHSPSERIPDRFQSIPLIVDRPAVPNGEIRGICHVRGNTFSLCTGNELRLYDMEEGRDIASLNSRVSETFKCVYSRRDQILIGGYWDPAIQMWKIDEDRLGESHFCLGTLEGDQGKVHSLQYHESVWPNRVLSGCDDKTGRIWDIIKKRQIRSLKGHSGIVSAIDVSVGSGRVIVTGSLDQTVSLWDSRSLEEIHVCPIGEGVYSLCCSRLRPHQLLVGAFHSVVVFDDRALSEPIAKGHSNTLYSNGIAEIDDSCFATSTFGKPRGGGECYIWSRSCENLATIELQGSSYDLSRVVTEGEDDDYE